MKKKYTCLIVIILVVSSFIVYSRILDNVFVNLDDNQYIVENNHIKSGINTQSIQWAFTTTYFGYWHPITWLSHMLDWNLFGANAAGYHFINLVLHIGTALFLFLFLNKTTKNIWPSAFVSILFALHPLRVESVAWAAERKDVLSMFFGMASIYTYSFYNEDYKVFKYFICLGLFALSLMSKPLLVTLPFILLLLDYWPLGRWTKKMSSNNRNSKIRIFMEKIPFILLSVICSMLTFGAQNKVGALASIEQLPFSVRIHNAVISYVTYLKKFLWPVDLAVFYPYEQAFQLWQIITTGFILLMISFVAVFYIKKLPFLFVGWFWYLGTFIPMIGLVQAGMQGMADRHTYLPFIGIALMLSWIVPLLFSHDALRKKILFSAGTATLVILASLTWQQCGYWKNTFELFNHALHVTKNNVLAHNSRGIAYGELGQYQFAIDDFNEAIRLKPDYAKAYNNRGLAYLLQGQIIPGCQDAQKACELGNCRTLETATKKGYCYSFDNVRQQKIDADKNVLKKR